MQDAGRYAQSCTRRPAPRMDVLNSPTPPHAYHSHTHILTLTHTHIQVKGSGRFLALCSLRPATVVFDGTPLSDFSHRLTDDGVPYLEIQLPEGYTGASRPLVVRWDKDSRAAAAAESGSGLGRPNGGDMP